MDATFTVTEDLYASKGKRFINYIIDLIVFFILFMLLLTLFGFILLLIGADLETFLYELENINRLLDRVISAILYSLSFIAIESLLKGRTIGKYITKTKVVDIHGNVPSLGVIFKRSFSRIIPFDAFSFLGDEGRGWHDTISETYVVDVEKLKNKKTIARDLADLGKKEGDL